jgi:hypothetical protein
MGQLHATTSGTSPRDCARGGALNMIIMTADGPAGGFSLALGTDVHLMVHHGWCH